MTLIIETGAGVAGASTYVSAVDFITYAAARGYTINPVDAEKWIILAMDYLETLQFIGVKQQRDQSLQWPRYDVVIDSWHRDPNTIPPELIKAENEIAIQMSLGNDPIQNREPDIKSEQVGSIKVEYADGASSITLPIRITNFLAKLVEGGGASFKVGRA